MAGGSGWQVAVEAGGFLHQGRSALAKNFAKTNPSQSNGCQLAGILQAKMRTKASLNQAGGCDHLIQPPSLEVSSKVLLNDNGLLLLDNMHCVLQHPNLPLHAEAFAEWAAPMLHSEKFALVGRLCEIRNQLIQSAK